MWCQERVKISTYRRWEHNEMLQARNEMLERSRDLLVVPPSFTPINRPRNHPTTIGLQRSLESDALYDLREDNVPEISEIKSRKRPAVSKGRHVSFTSLREYEDDNDQAHHNNGPHFEESSPKRKQTAPSEQSKPVKVLAKISKQPWGHDGGNDGTQKRGSQLSNPPNSGKRAKGKVGFLPSKTNSRAKKVFQDTTVTKNLPARKNGIAESSTIELINSYHGFKTTEEMVKSATVSLSKTTLDKLVSFRYNPSSITVPLANIPIEVDAYATLDLPQCMEALPNSHGSSAAKDHILSSQSYYEQAAWHAGIVDDYLRNEQVQCVPIDNPRIVSNGDGSPRLTGMSKIDQSASFDVARDAGHRHLLQARPQAMISNASQNASNDRRHLDYGNGYDEPTSSESVFLQTLLASVVVGSDGNFDQEAPLALDKEKDNCYRLSNSGTASNSRDGFTGHTIELPVDLSIETEDGSHPISHGPPSLESSNSGPNVAYDLPRLNGNRFPASSIGTVPQKDQTETVHSDLDDYDAVTSVVYESDQFDEGLDDEDLLAIIPDIAVSKNQLKDLPSQKWNESANSPYPTLFGMQLGSTANRELTVKGPTSITNPNSMSYTSPPQIILSDSNDEFPVDKDDEEEMLKLPELHDSANRIFVNPASVKQAFNDGLYHCSRLFNNDFHFSPQPCPENFPEIYETDKCSPIGSPRKKLNRGASPANAEEDWGCIRTDNRVRDTEIQNMPDPFTKTLPVADRRLTIDLPSSSPAKRTISMISETSTCASQVTASSAMSVSDDSHEYEPLLPFTRPEFPALVMDHCPVIGLSPHTFLQTCFRIGEMFYVGTKCNALGLDAVIELFARVNFSSRESGTTKQNFQFLDLWHNRPPHPNGILASFKTTGLADTESKCFLTGNEKKMARALGRLKRNGKKGGGSWCFEIINIRETDWEEIRWTKRIVSGDDLAKKERELRGDCSNKD